MWLEFARLAYCGFSLTCSPNKYLSATWISAAVLTVLTTFNWPFQNFTFSSSKRGDKASTQRRFNKGRGFGSLVYPYIAARTMLLPRDVVWVNYLDCLVAFVTMLPIQDIVRTYPSTLSAYFEWIFIASMASYNSDSSILSTEASRAFAYNQSLLWTLMVFDGFLGYTLYNKGLLSADSVCSKVKFLSSSHCVVFCLMFWRSPSGLSPLFVFQVMYRHLNLGKYSFYFYKAGSMGHAMHCFAWLLWAFTQQSATVLALVFSQLVIQVFKTSFYSSSRQRAPKDVNLTNVTLKSVQPGQRKILLPTGASSAAA